MPNAQGPIRQAISNPCWDGQHDDCGLHAPDGKPCVCPCHDSTRATRSNENARQTAQDEASAVRGLTTRSYTYLRLPKALQAIVDAYNLLDLACDSMSYANTAGDLRPEDVPSVQMLAELSSLVEHTKYELRRHGVLEGALAWLASHPEGWDDEPEPEPVKRCRHCDGILTGDEQRGNVCNDCLSAPDEAGDDPLLHGYPREWFTGDRS